MPSGISMFDITEASDVDDFLFARAYTTDIREGYLIASTTPACVLGCREEERLTLLDAMCRAVGQWR